jgi:methylmalonyl-CoA mutase C-terminal domain/subunit
LEVIDTVLHQTIESIVQLCIQEDVGVLDFSLLMVGTIITFLKSWNCLKKGVEHMLIVARRSIILDEDVPLLKQKGIKEIFGRGKSRRYFKFITDNVKH